MSEEPFPLLLHTLLHLPTQMVASKQTRMHGPNTCADRLWRRIRSNGIMLDEEKRMQTP
jgi:hypothetical protein